MLERLRLAVDQFGQPDPQHGPSVRQWHVAADAGTDPYLNAEFLRALADQGVFVALSGLDLAAGKLPPAGDFSGECQVTPSGT